MLYRSSLILLTLLPGLSLAAERPTPAKTVDFVHDIQPILTRSCLSCHNARKQRGGLRLDEVQAALRGGDTGAVLKPNDAAHSRLFLLVAGRDPDLKMPPAGKPPL